MICKVRTTLDKFLMLEDTNEIIVGFSGGADSTCLLYILNSLKNEFNFKLRAAHVNHCLRGEESDRDEKFVRDFCNKYSIELSLIKIDVFAEAKKAGKSVEEYGRYLRYDFFNSLCSEKSKIATAHNFNDCEETLIFNLSRGSGLKGLCSIPPVRGKIIRPLIECTRDEIEYFCQTNSIQFVTDSTNLSDDYTRNKIRHNIIPVLKEINSSFDVSVSRCVESLRIDEDYFKCETEKLYNKIKLKFGFDAYELSKAHTALKRRVISKIIFEKCNVIPEKRHINLVESILSGGRVELFFGETIVVRNSVIYFLSDLKKRNFEKQIISFDSENVWQNDDIRLEKTTECTQNIYKELVLSTLDSDKINGNLVLRKRQEGDKITLPARKVSKSLKKLFNEMKIPSETRDSIYVLSDDVSVVWVEKIGADLRVAPDKDSVKFIRITVAD